MRICAVLPDLGAGGAQRVIATLADEFRHRGHDIVVITFDDQGGDFYALADGVERVAIGGLGASRSAIAALLSNARRVRALRRVIEAQHADLVLSFIDSTNIVTILATRLLGVPVVVSERIHPPRYPMPRPWPTLRRLTYPLADAVVMQTEMGRRWAEGLVSRERVAVIANPLSPRFHSSPVGEINTRSRLIVAAGRLEVQKGFDLLIDAFASSRAPGRGWTLRIHGKGSQEQALRAQATERGVAASVSISGETVALEDELRHAQVFVLASRFEGFPNVLIEAMASGCAVIATDCETGPADIVTHSVDGLLVAPDSVASIRDAIDALVDDDALRARLARSATQVRERFGSTRISDQWLAVFNASTSRGRNRRMADPRG